MHEEKGCDDLFLVLAEWVERKWFARLLWIWCFIQLLFAGGFYFIDLPVITGIFTLFALLTGGLAIIRKQYTTMDVLLLYGEVILLNIIITACLGFNNGFYFYLLGVFFVLVLLLQGEKKWRILLQTIGVLTFLLLLLFDWYLVPFYRMPDFADKLLFAINFIVTILAMMAITYRYEQAHYQVQEVLEVLETTNTELIQINSELDYKATHDALTGLLNRHSLMAMMDDIVSQKRQEVIVCMVDVDNFKDVNDIYGHDVGDMVLEKLSRLMKESLVDFYIARWGGEEFVLLNNTTSRHEALDQVNAFHEQLRKEIFLHRQFSLKITVTIGFTWSKEPDEIEKLIEEADRLMYWGKKHGRNQVVVKSKQLEISTTMMGKRPPTQSPKQ